MKRRALISVTDRDGIGELAKALIQSNFEIIATTGTAQALRAYGCEVTSIEQVTGVGELAGGRVKTLHPNVFAAILADRDSREEMAELEKEAITPIDIVIVNLYDFQSKPSVEEIDIGGVALIRAAAKNHRFVTVIPDPTLYQEMIDSLPMGLTDSRRQELAALAFATTMRYEMEIARHFASPLRYGENPHQSGVLLRTNAGVAGAKRMDPARGKDLSYNNYLDADSAWRAVQDHSELTCAIVKHGNPCGIASDKSPLVAFKKALESDPVSSFGGVVAINGLVDEGLAQSLSEIFLEVIVASDFTESALDLLASRKELRLLQVDKSHESGSFTGHFISGGLLIEGKDGINQEPLDWELVAGSALSREMMEELQFAWRCIRSVKSNAIVIAKNFATVGIGMGQVSRVDAARLAVLRAGEKSHGAVAASDGFFPFADGAMELARAGVRALVQPGGSKRDNEVIEAISSAGMTMYFTGRRHFSH